MQKSVFNKLKYAQKKEIYKKDLWGVFTVILEFELYDNFSTLQF